MSIETYFKHAECGARQSRAVLCSVPDAACQSIPGTLNLPEGKIHLGKLRCLTGFDQDGTPCCLMAPTADLPGASDRNNLVLVGLDLAIGKLRPSGPVSTGTIADASMPDGGFQFLELPVLLDPASGRLAFPRIDIALPHLGTGSLWPENRLQFGAPRRTRKGQQPFTLCLHARVNGFCFSSQPSEHGWSGREPSIPATTPSRLKPQWRAAS